MNLISITCATNALVVFGHIFKAKLLKIMVFFIGLPNVLFILSFADIQSPIPP